MRRAVLVFAVILMLVGPVMAKYSGGTGDANDPYQIGDVNDLLAFSEDSNDHDKYVVLIDDINLADCNFTDYVMPWFSGHFDGDNHTISNVLIQGNADSKDMGFWDTLNNSFVCNLNIKNINIENFDLTFSSYGCHVGCLAGYTHSANIENCSVKGFIRIIQENPSISVEYSGGLIGQNNASINNCSFEGSVIDNRHAAGGLIGRNFGPVSNCNTNCYVNSTERVGGLIGVNYEDVSNCFSIAQIDAPGNPSYFEDNVGGFIGKNSASAILNSGCIADINCPNELQNVGGFVGFNTNAGTIENCYCQTTIDANDCPEIGGFIGNNGQSESIGGCFIENCYSATAVNLDDYNINVGGFAGANFSSKITNCYWDRDLMTSLVTEGVAYDVNSTVENLTELSTAEMKDQSNYEGFDFIYTLLDGEENSWAIKENDYPILSWQDANTIVVPDVTGMQLAEALQELDALEIGNQLTFFKSIAYNANEVISQSIAPGSCITRGYYSIGLNVSGGNDANGSSENPYPISLPEDIEYLTSNPCLYDKCFIVIRDIDMQGKEYDTAIVNPFAGVDSNTPFAGVFDGNDHTIKNLSFNIGNSNNYAIALFSNTSSQAVIKNLSLYNVVVNKAGDFGAQYVAALVGNNAGNIMNCSVKTNIDAEGLSNIGGLCGENSGEINRCFADTIVSASKFDVGGLVGYNIGEIIDCSADVNLSALWSVGGLVGNNYNSSVHNCYTTGTVVCDELDAGGLIGMQSESQILNCYSHCTISGQDNIGGIIGSTTFGEIVNCYFAGSISGNAEIGGILGRQGRPCVITNCYFLEGCAPDNGYGVALSDEQMKDQGSFAGWDFVNDGNGSDDVWFMPRNGYPKLCFEALRTDLYIDGITDFKDYGLFADYWQSNSLDGDLNNDAMLDMNDLEILSQNWLLP